jgi:hypothetical protein
MVTPLSCNTNQNGLSQINSTYLIGVGKKLTDLTISIAVIAAASVPSSSTWMKVFYLIWSTLIIYPNY